MKALDWLYKVLNPKYTQWFWLVLVLVSLVFEDYVLAILAGMFHLSDRAEYQIEKTRTTNINMKLNLNDEPFSGTVDQEVTVNEKENI